jgi:hypothetical protein
MVKNLEKPNWYQEEFYNKVRTPEEWLYEILKRNNFLHNGYFQLSISLLPLEEKGKFFLNQIFEDRIDNALSFLQAEPSQPIRALTVSDVFRMASLISNSDWYKTHPDKMIFENAIAGMSNGKTLTPEEKNVFNKFYNTPWHFFHENSKDNNWYPNKDITHLSGIPLSIDPGYAKEDTAKQLKNYLTRCVGKLQDIELHFEAWQERKILALFDLMMWFKVQEIEYTNINLHRLIWPKGRFSSTQDEYINPDDDIEDSVKLVIKIINQNVIRTLAIMCEARKSKKETEKC